MLMVGVALAVQSSREGSIEYLTRATGAVYAHTVVFSRNVIWERLDDCVIVDCVSVCAINCAVQWCESGDLQAHAGVCRLVGLSIGLGSPRQQSKCRGDGS